MPAFLHGQNSAQSGLTFFGQGRTNPATKIPTPTGPSSLRTQGGWKLVAKAYAWNKDRVLVNKRTDHFFYTPHHRVDSFFVQYDGIKTEGIPYGLEYDQQGRIQTVNEIGQTLEQYHYNDRGLVDSVFSMLTYAASTSSTLLTFQYDDKDRVLGSQIYNGTDKTDLTLSYDVGHQYYEVKGQRVFEIVDSYNAKGVRIQKDSLAYRYPSASEIDIDYYVWDVGCDNYMLIVQTQEFYDGDNLTKRESEEYNCSAGKIKIKEHFGYTLAGDIVFQTRQFTTSTGAFEKDSTYLHYDFNVEREDLIHPGAQMGEAGNISGQSPAYDLYLDKVYMHHKLDKVTTYFWTSTSETYGELNYVWEPIVTNTQDEYDEGPFLYPNPAYEYLCVDGEKVSGSLEYFIYSDLGAVLSSGSLNRSGKINIASLPSGRYTVVLLNGEASVLIRSSLLKL